MLWKGKTPGPDGVPTEVVKLAVTVAPEEILQTFNILYRNEVFPKVWETGKLVLIPKKKKNEERRPKTRPICLLNCIGKLYEHLIRDRLMKEVESKEKLSDKQYGFRQKISTIDAIVDVLSLNTGNS